MSEQKKDGNPAAPEEFVTLDQGAISELQDQFGVDMQVRSTQEGVTRVIEASMPGRRDGYDRRDGRRDGYDRRRRDGYDRRRGRGRGRDGYDRRD